MYFVPVFGFEFVEGFAALLLTHLREVVGVSLESIF